MKKIEPPKITFSWEDITSTMLCVRVKDGKLGKGTTSHVNYFQIPTSNEADSLLQEMVHKTWMAFKSDDGSAKSLRQFELSELYGGTEQLFAKHDDETLAQASKLLGQTSPETINAGNLGPILEAMELYYAVFHDSAGNKLIGCKQSRTVKRNLRQSKRTLIFGGDKLVPLSCPVFSLDEVFDYLVFNEGVFILRPTQFTQTTVGSKALRSAMAQIAPKLSDRINFVSFDRIAQYVSRSVSGAKLIASIKDKPQLEFLTEKRLKADLKKQKVNYEVVNGLISPEKGSELQFLLYLDFRLFGYEWKRGSPEHLVAKARVSRDDSDEDLSIGNSN